MSRPDRTFVERGDRLVMRLHDFEVDLLRDLRSGVESLVRGGDPDDPVVARLFPPAVADDPENDEQVRDMIHDALLTSRLEGLRALGELLATGERRRGGRLEIELTDDEPALVLGVVNDLRLALAARVGIEDLDIAEVAARDPDHHVRQSIGVIEHLAWWQEQLLEIMDPEVAAHRGEWE